jgi:UDPglucose 6-dehydrogenase
MADATIGVWGLAYKENTHSTKNSPSIAFLSAIPECRKQAYDPTVRLSTDAFPRFSQCGSALDCCVGATALVIPTPWPEFRGIDVAKIRNVMPGQIILDPYGLLNAVAASESNFDYYRLGLPSRRRRQTLVEKN